MVREVEILPRQSREVGLGDEELPGWLDTTGEKAPCKFTLEWFLERKPADSG